MLQITSIEPETEPAVPRAGPHYPNRCLECPEMLAETYGCHTPLRCVECVAADFAGRVSRSAVN